MIKWLRRAWFKHVLFRSRVPYPIWHHCIRSSPILLSLDHMEEHRLRQLTGIFLREKSFSAADGLQLTDAMCLLIAAQACLLILNLELDYYDGWHEIIVYPGAFMVKRDERDLAGVVHRSKQALAGESWSRGPVVLSWDSIVNSQKPGNTANVIVHEFAHKLDMLNGSADGFPPLHRNMKLADWTEAFSSAFEHLTTHQHQQDIDAYGATSPGEFFAVVSEAFFVQPLHLHKVYPDVYKALMLFYRQDPASRLSSHPA